MAGFEFRFPGGWRRSLAAVLIGNLIFFAANPYLPEALRYRYNTFGPWIFVDLLACVLVLRLTFLVWKDE